MNDTLRVSIEWFTGVAILLFLTVAGIVTGVSYQIALTFTLALLVLLVLAVIDKILPSLS